MKRLKNGIILGITVIALAAAFITGPGIFEEQLAFIIWLISTVWLILFATANSDIDA